MALSKDKKLAVVDEFTQNLSGSKVVVMAEYSGLSVKEMQALRKAAGEANVSVKVLKNRLAKIAFSNVAGYKDAAMTQLSGQIAYATSSEDEVAPAQVLYTFAKKHPALALVGAVDASGQVMDTDQITALAQLPSKEQLHGQLVGTIAAPLSGFVNVLSANMRGLVNVLNARQAEL